MDMYSEVASRLKIGVKTITVWIKDFEAMTYIRESQRGKHSKSYSPILQDERFRDVFKDYIKENSKKQGKAMSFTDIN